MCVIARNIWIKHNGQIPIDENGRTYEIHHKDRNNKNHSIDNLMCISIKEHYDIHYQLKEWGACTLIAKRMNLPKDFVSKIQLGRKRPGIGGVKKGTVPWNKGKTYKMQLSEQTRELKKMQVKQRAIISDIDASIIRDHFAHKMPIADCRINTIQGNGRLFTYDWAFCKYYATAFGVNPVYIKRIITGKSKHV